LNLQNKPIPLYLWAALISATFLLHGFSAFGLPVGIFADDFVQIALAQSLRHGRFGFLDWMHLPVTNVMPAFPAMLAAPAWLAEPHWAWLRIIPLLSAWMAIYGAWRIARASLPPTEAGLTAALVAIHPSLVQYTGAVLPDLPYVGLTAYLVWRFSERKERGPIWGLAAGAASASLMRPFGCLLALSFAFALWRREGRRGLQFLAVSMAPLGAWLLRNRLASGVASGYLSDWALQMQAKASLWEQTKNAGRIVAFLFVRSLALLDGMPAWPTAALGMGLLALACYGAWLFLRQDRGAWRLAVVGYTASLLAVYATWNVASGRYVLPLLPFALLFLFLAARDLLSGYRLPAGLALLLWSSLAFRRDAGIARRADFSAPETLSQTMEWIRTNTPESARFQAVNAAQVLVMAGRPAASPPWDSSDAATWFDRSKRDGFQYLLICPRLRPSGYSNTSVERLLTELPKWARGQGAAVQYRNDEEGTAVFRF